MQANQTESANFSVASKLETPVAVGENRAASAALLTASAGSAAQGRTDWSVIAEEDSSFFVPQRCTALDDF